MSYWRFVTANAVGALTWGVAITVLGYFAAANPQTIVDAAARRRHDPGAEQQRVAREERQHDAHEQCRADEDETPL
jgi:hypothetical protein